jgi:UDP:flavonoid glycosyltransferase YjiC (YdhE family)
MKVLFVTWAGGGNSTPVLGLATRLIARGHRVGVASPDDMSPRFAAAGVDYDVFERDQVVALIEGEGPDLVVVDFMMPSWMSQAEASSVPWVALVHTLYDRMAAGLLTAFTTLDAINDERNTLGLDALDDASALLDRAARVLITAPAALDAATSLPANTVHVGTILEDPGPDAAWVPPWPDRPLVVMSPGTTPGLDEGPVIERMLAAVDGKPLRVLVNVGAHLDTSAIAVPDNAALVGYVRHAAVMPHADAVVTHAGLGSICAALSHGLPLVCIPLDRDQPHNAERVVAVGAGVSLSREASPDELWSALDRVLADDRYRAAAAPFAREYDASASLAIGELESLAN